MQRLYQTILTHRVPSFHSEFSMTLMFYLTLVPSLFGQNISCDRFLNFLKIHDRASRTKIRNEE